MSNEVSAQHDVQYTESEGILTITLSRSKAFNSLSFAMLRELEQILTIASKSKTARIVIIRAQGRAFCAGHDLKEIGACKNTEEIETLFKQCSKVMLLIARLPQPVIAAVQGIATAAGCQLVAACDLAIATDKSRFAASGIKYGLFCSTPMVALSRNVSRKNAMAMLLTGDFIGADKALDWGLVNETASDDLFEEKLRSMTARLISKPAHVLAMGKRLYYEQMEMGISDAYDLTTKAIAQNAMDASFQAGLEAFKYKNEPNFEAFSNPNRPMDRYEDV